MSFIKKMKDILFEEEEYTEPIQIRDEVKEEPKIVKIDPINEPKEEKVEVKKEEVPEFRETPKPKVENTFTFPDFDEDEFVNNISKSNNVLEYERKKSVERRTNYGPYERVETKETIERKKFKPSPIISPVYGILNQDYRAEDIIKREETPNVDIDYVRKKAFEKKKEEEIDEPVVTFFEEKEEIKEIPKEEVIEEKVPERDYKTIDDLLEDASHEVDLEDTIEMPKVNNLEEIEEELEKLDVEEKEEKKETKDDDADLFELIDSMYDSREE